MSDSRRVLFVLTNHDELGDTGEETGYYLPEAAHPYRVLREAGYEIDFVSPEGGPVPVDPESRDLEDEANASFLEAEEEALEDTLAAGEIDPDDYAAIYFAGGHGTMWDFPDCRPLAEATTRIWENGGVVGAVCHGPAGLVNVRLSDGAPLVDGREVSCFTNEEERAVECDEVVPFLLETRLEERGATVRKAEPWQEKVVVDGRLVTGQNPASAEGVGEGMVRVLEPEPAGV